MKKNKKEAVSFVLLKPSKEILMQQRDDGNGQKILYPNMWCIPGGHCEDGEEPSETVVREIKEEYRLDVKKNDCKFIGSYIHDGGNDNIFICKVNDSAQPTLCEGKALAWNTIEEIKKMKLGWRQNEILDLIEKSI